MGFPSVEDEVSDFQEREQQLGLVTQQMNDEFDRKKATLGDVRQAALQMGAYIDALGVAHRADRALLNFLEGCRTRYRDLARRS
jgi:hypothetical protein